MRDINDCLFVHAHSASLRRPSTTVLSSNATVAPCGLHAAPSVSATCTFYNVDTHALRDTHFHTRALGSELRDLVACWVVCRVDKALLRMLQPHRDFVRARTSCCQPLRNRDRHRLDDLTLRRLEQPADLLPLWRERGPDLVPHAGVDAIVTHFHGAWEGVWVGLLIDRSRVASAWDCTHVAAEVRAPTVPGLHWQAATWRISTRQHQPIACSAVSWEVQ